MLKSATRADGKAIQAANAWLSQTWDRDARRWDYFVNVFDANNTGGWSYMVEFVPAGPIDNRPPKLDPLPDRDIYVGNYLSFPVTAFDRDGDLLTYTMLFGPTNATLNPATGLFHWRPLRAQAPSTNIVQVKVTDDREPPLSDTGQFKIIVRKADKLELSLGTTNLFAGETNSVAVVLKSDVDLTNVVFVLNVPAATLTNFALSTIGPEVFSYGLTPIGPNIFSLQFEVDPFRVQNSTRTLARLGFQSLPIPASTISPLNPNELLGQNTQGRLITNGVANSGRVFVFVNEPLLDIAAKPTPAVTLYGRPGAS